MSNDMKLMPELRFPEFANQGEWEYYDGNELFESISNKNHDSDLPILAITQEHGAIPRDLIEYTVIATQKSIASYKVVETGDFIISLRSFQGGIEYSLYKGICSPAYIVLRRKLELDEMFFKHYFKSELYIRQLNKHLEGMRDGKMVSFKQFSEILLPLPSLEEQQKVSNFLSNLDSLIDKETDRLNNYKQHKLGLSQNLFPKCGQENPVLRFTEFKNNDSWKPRLVDELIVQHNEKSEINNQYPVLTSSREGIMLQSEYYNNRNVASKDNTGYNVVPRGYFTYRHMSDDLVFKFNINTICDRGIVSTLYPVFSAREDLVYPDFLRYILNEGYEFKEFAASRKQGGSRTYMYLSKLKNLKISIPRLDEQKKIAKCLISLDNLISSQAKKIKELQEQKKGLMQGLFPKTEN